MAVERDGLRHWKLEPNLCPNLERSGTVLSQVRSVGRGADHSRWNPHLGRESLCTDNANGKPTIPTTSSNTQTV
eukprot:3940842-Rhodomonas_salina.2